VCLCDVDSASGATWAAPQVGSTAALLGGSTGTVRVMHVPSTGGSQRRCAVYLHEREPAPTQGEFCEITPSVRRELIGVYQVKSGANVTDVYQRFQDISTDANGCVTRGDPYCVVAPTDCGTSRDPVFYCIDDVCWEYYDGLIPAEFDAGPFETAEACDEGCPYVPPPGTIETDCCPDNLLRETLTLTLGGTLAGVGPVTLTWVPASNWWSGSAAGCGGTITFELACPGPTNAWSFSFYGAVNGLWGGTSVSCDPFQISGSGSISGGTPCDGTFTFTVTE
jgi:hypothetical protein